MFNSTGPHYCPVCPPIQTKRGLRYHKLELIESNYSGCGVDMAICDKCRRGFCISYKVDKIERDRAWDGEGVEDDIVVTINRGTTGGQL